MVILSNKIKCPICESDCTLKNYDMMWAESEIHCPKHGYIGDRYHDDGWNGWHELRLKEIREDEAHETL